MFAAMELQLGKEMEDERTQEPKKADLAPKKIDSAANKIDSVPKKTDSVPKKKGGVVDDFDWDDGEDDVAKKSANLSVILDEIDEEIGGLDDVLKEEQIRKSRMEELSEVLAEADDMNVVDDNLFR